MDIMFQKRYPSNLSNTLVFQDRHLERAMGVRNPHCPAFTKLRCYKPEMNSGR